MINTFLKHFGIVVNRHKKNKNKGYNNQVVFLTPKGKPRGNVLLSYIIEPFLVSDEKLISNAHHHDWLSWRIAMTFLDEGYSIDAIDYRNSVFKPQKDYAFFIGARTNFQRLSKLLNKDCYKIVHLDTAHWIFNNLAAYQRCMNVQQKRRITLKTYKNVEDNWAIEHADMATTNMGNQFNVGTYAYAKKPVFQIPLPTCSTYASPENKNFSKCKKNFLWIGSNGFIHKGLDRVLEAFAELPDYHLTVCGPFNGNGKIVFENPLGKESDFERAFQKELYYTPNIHTIGWVDIDSPRFNHVANSCVAVVFPSCAEGGGASAITCMQAGLIPCVSYESNVEVRDFGITLPHASVQEIKRAVEKIANTSEKQLSQQAVETWKFARTYHTRDYFTKEYKLFVERIQTNPLDAISHNQSSIQQYRGLSSETLE